MDKVGWYTLVFERFTCAAAYIQYTYKPCRAIYRQADRQGRRLLLVQYNNA